MSRPLLFALIASSPLVIGAWLGAKITLPERLLAAVLAFAAGALITAVSSELFEQSFEKGGAVRAALGLAAGAITFTVLSVLLDRHVAKDSDPDGSAKLDKDAATDERAASAASSRGGAGLALLGAVTLDGVPENAALGISLQESGGVGAASMRAQGRSTGYVLGLWTLVASPAQSWSGPDRSPQRPTKPSRSRSPSLPAPSSPPWQTRSCPRRTRRAVPSWHC
jgi:ZIP family zinc transporter